jgi:hypothetical protein
MTHVQKDVNYLFEKYKIESTKENLSIENRNNSGFNLYAQKNNYAKINKTNNINDENKKEFERNKDSKETEIIFPRNNISSVISCNDIIKNKYSSKSSPHQRINKGISKEGNNLQVKLQGNEGIEKNDIKDFMLITTSNYDNHLKIRNKSIEKIELIKNNAEKLLLNEDKNIDFNIKEIESFIKNNGLKNSVGSILKTSAKNLSMLTNQREKILISCKSQANILNKKTGQIFSNQNDNEINEVNKAQKARLLEEIRNNQKNKSIEILNFGEYNCNLNCDFSENNNKTDDDSNKSIIKENNKSNSVTNYYDNENPNVYLNNNILLKSTISDNTPYNSNFNIYSNLNLSALNKINDKIENLHPNFNRNPAYINTNSIENKSEKLQFLTDTSMDKNKNIALSGRFNTKSSKVILQTIISSAKNKPQIEIEDSPKTKSEEFNYDNLKGSVFHYQNKLLPEENLYGKNNLSGKKPNIQKIKNARCIKTKTKNNIFNNNRNNEEVNFMGIKKSQIMNFDISKSANSSRDLNNLAKSFNYNKKQEVYDVKDLDLYSLVENEKIIEISKDKKKVLYSIYN